MFCLREFGLTEPSNLLGCNGEPSSLLVGLIKPSNLLGGVLELQVYSMVLIFTVKDFGVVEPKWRILVSGRKWLHRTAIKSILLLSSQEFVEGLSTIRPPLCDGTNYNIGKLG